MSTICLRDRPDPLPTAENVLDMAEVNKLCNVIFRWNFDDETLKNINHYQKTGQFRVGKNDKT